MDGQVWNLYGGMFTLDQEKSVDEDYLWACEFAKKLSPYPDSKPRDLLSPEPLYRLV